MNSSQNAIKELFNTSPELLKIGTLEQYLNYVNSIFPNSKIKDVVYHGGKKGIEQFNKPTDSDFNKNKGVGSGTKDFGIYFTADKNTAKYYSKGYSSKERQIYPVLLNIQKPYITNVWFALNIRKALNGDVINPQSITKKDYEKLKNLDFDSIVWHGSKGELIVFEPEQIHILGSQKDINEFKKFVNNLKMIKESIKQIIKEEVDKMFPQIFYHVTHKDNVNSILKNGLLINQKYYMTQGGSWAKHAYGMNPIFLSMLPTKTAKQKLVRKDDVIFKVDVSDLELVADLPSLIDFGAYITHDSDAFYWPMGKEPRRMLKWIDEESGEVYFDDLLNPYNPITEDAILLTKSCAVMQNIPPNKISLY